MQKFLHWESRLVYKSEIAKNILEMHFTLSDKSFSFIPGQFVGIQVPIRKVPRAYSIVKKIDNTLVFLIDISPWGINSKYFAQMQVGDKVLMSGPFGRYKMQETQRNKYFICTSTGVAPFLAMLDNVFDSEIDKYLGTKFYLIFGCRYRKDDFVLSKIQKFLSYQQFNYIRCISRENLTSNIIHVNSNFLEFKGRVTLYLTNLPVDSNSDEFYICGSNEMVGEVVKLLKEQKNAVNIYTEKYY